MAYVDPIIASRAYLYTYVTAYGEEGPPSPPDVQEGIVGDTWVVTVTPPSSSAAEDRNIEKFRLYRTVTAANGTASYYLVDEFPISQTTYNDALDDEDITGNITLESEGWTEPPTGLEGWIAMPNGIIAAWKDNELWFCEPYRPHAWPAAYQVSVDYPIVGLGVMGQTLIVATKGTPWAVTGSRPSTMTLSKIDTFEPCVSRDSIISTPEGVYYASPNGIVVAVPGRVAVVTDKLILPDQWQSLNELSKLQAIKFGSAYMALERNSASTTGFTLDVSDPRIAYTELEGDDELVSIDVDPWSDTAIIIRDGNVYSMPIPDGTAFEPFLWRSKLFQLPDKDNYGAMKVYFTVPSGTAALAPTRTTSPETLASDMYAVLRVYADGEEVYSRELRESGEPIRLPSGFKAEFWQVEVEARVRLDSVQIATSMKELRRV